MSRIIVKSVYGNDMVIEKIEPKDTEEFRDLYQILVNEKGYVLDSKQLQKLSDFFKSIEFEAN